MTPDYGIERMPDRELRQPSAAPHAERCAPNVGAVVGSRSSAYR